MLGAANGARAQVDASQYTVTCNPIAKTLALKPPLTAAGGATAGLASLKATLGGCTATPNAGGTPVTITSGSISGKVAATTNTCTALQGPSNAVGTLVVKWKTVPSLVVPFSALNLGAITGGIYGPTPWGGSYGQFKVGGAGVSVAGSFAGPDGGVTSTITMVTSQDGTALLGLCVANGIKSVTIRLGGLTLQ